MKKLSVSVVLILFTSIYYLFFVPGVRVESSGDFSRGSYTLMDDPTEYFGGNTGNWSFADGVYSGTYGFSPAYSYTTFSRIEDSFTPDYNLTNYKVRFYLNRPATSYSVAFPHIVVGAGSTGTPLKTECFKIEFTNSNMLIYEYTNTYKSFFYHNVSNPVIGLGEEFLFEISVTPDLIEIFINNSSEPVYSYVPIDGQEAGLFGLGNKGNQNTAVHFKDISYSFPEEVEVSVTPGEDAFSFSVAATGALETDRFQVWLKAKRDVDGSDSGNFADWVYSWNLIKAFDVVDLDSGVTFADGRYSFDFTVPEHMKTSHGEYEVYVRYKEGSLVDTILFDSLYDVQSSDGSLLVSPAAGNPGPGDGQEGLDRFVFTCDSVLDIPDLVVGQDLVFDLKGSDGLGGFKIAKLGGSGGIAPVDAGDEVFYKFRYGEAFRAPVVSSPYLSVSSFSGTMTLPGIYQIFGFVSGRGSIGYDDGLVRYFKVLRGGGGGGGGGGDLPVSGSAAFSSIDLSVSRGGETVLESGVGDGTNVVNSVSIEVDDLVSLTVFGSGLELSDGSLDYPDGLYQYSIWRLDVSGYRLLKDWSSDSSFYFRPASPGHYTLQMRVKGVDAGSYEDARNLRLVVSPLSGVGDISLGYEVSGGDVSDGGHDTNVVNFVAGEEVVFDTGEEVILTASSSGAGNYVYRFEVWDSFLGSVALGGFSPVDTVSWVPRKPGDYRIIVRAQDISSMGFGDLVEVFEVVVG